MIVNIYWELRDFWQYRWHKVESQNIDAKIYQIPVIWEKKSESNLIGGTLWKKKNSSGKGPLIVFIYGFSDDQESITFLTIPIVIAGYEVFTFDTRGKKKSRTVGKKNQFVETIRDVKDVIDWIVLNEEFKEKDIIIVGTSLGAISAINNGILFPQIKKIIAISAMSNFRNNFPHSTITFIGKWWYWLRYSIFGVNLKPTDKINTDLSPSIQLNNYLNQSSDQKILTDIPQKLTLIHAYDDPIVNIQNFYENKEISQISMNKWMITRKGGHLFRKYELSLLAKILEAIKNSDKSI